MWAKISKPATTMACAACMAVAATLPWMGTAAERIASENMRLTAFTDVDAFSAIPLYLDILFGDDAARLEAIAGLDSINGVLAGNEALSALPVYVALLGGDLGALSDLDGFSAIPEYLTLLDPTSTTEDRLAALGNLDSVSAIPVFVEFANAAAAGDAQGAAAALGGYDALSAVDTFFGDGPVGADGETPVGGVFTGGGIDALAPNADSGGGYAALSALPVFFGSNAPNTNFGPGVFTGGGLSALSNYDALSAIPAYLNLPPNEAPPLPPPPPAPLTAPEEMSALRTTSTAALPGGGTGTQSPPSFAPKVQVQPQVEELKPPVTTPDNSGAANQNITRTSQKFEPTKLGESPFLFGSGGQGVDNGIRGWGEGLKKLGIGGADAPSGGDADGAE